MEAEQEDTDTFSEFDSDQDATEEETEIAELPRRYDSSKIHEENELNDLTTDRSDSRQRSGSRNRTPRSSNIKAEFAGKNFVIPRNIKSIINIDQEKNQKIIKAVYNNVNSHYYGLVPLKNIDPQLEFYLGIRNP